MEKLCKNFDPGMLSGLPLGEKEGHGASAITGMTHLAMQQKLEGKVVEWMSRSPPGSTVHESHGASGYPASPFER